MNGYLPVAPKASLSNLLPCWTGPPSSESAEKLDSSFANFISLAVKSLMTTHIVQGYRGACVTPFAPCFLSKGASFMPFAVHQLSRAGIEIQRNSMKSLLICKMCHPCMLNHRCFCQVSVGVRRLSTMSSMRRLSLKNLTCRTVG